jgi:hypothetical protein
MAHRLTRSERCKQGKHTPSPARSEGEAEAVRRGVCRYCRRPIMRTQATRIWYLATMLA